MPKPTPSLNPSQREAVEHLAGPLLVIAGAGSGKTRVITEKIAYLVSKQGIKARNIAAVTFTNKAAREMKARATKLLGKDAARGLMVSTFHRLGLNILRREATCLGLKKNFSIYDGRDASQLLLELLKREAGTDKEFIERVRSQISLWKNDRITPKAALATATDPFQSTAAGAFAAYEKQLRIYNAADLDDLLGLPAQLFEQHPEALERWQNRIRYLLVDEYQDTNATQYQLVRLLTQGREALTIVGDDDQSIYSWRGARPENLEQLPKDFPRLKIIKLEQNYRSTNTILKAANTLIDNNPHVFKKRLWSEIGQGDPIRVMELRNEQQEAERVIGDLVHHRFRRGSKHGEYAILYRGNFQSRVLEKALREQGVPYVLTGGQSFFDYAEIKDLLAYLRLITNLQDSGSFLRIANTPRRELGPTTLEKLTRYAGERGVSLVEACNEMGLEQHLKPRALKRLREFADWLKIMARRAEIEDPVKVARALVNDIDYLNWIEDQYDDVQAERRSGNVEELFSWMERLKKNNEDSNLSDLIARMALVDIMDKADEQEVGDRVSLMTLHAAKGLEFPWVYLVGMEENLLPHRSSIDADTIEEERRLAYVGITRAQKGLTLSLSRQRRRYGETEECEPSRFLKELPEELVEWIGKSKDSNPEEQQQYGKAHLANMRSLLES